MNHKRSQSTIAALRSWLVSSDDFLARALRFGVMGGIVALVYALVTSFSATALDVEPVWAAVIGYFVSAPVSFFGHRIFSFRANGRPSVEVGRFLFSQALNLAIAAGSMAVAVHYFGAGHVWGIVLAVVLMPLSNFTFMNLWVFRDRKDADMTSMTDILKNPAIYQLYQNLGGFHGGRVSMIREFLSIQPGHRVVDIGCGPGHIVRDLPAGIEYHGYDIDERSIAFANDHFGDLGTFSARFYDADAAREIGQVDFVLMNGVMHHIPDAELIDTLRHIKASLKPGGVLFTADGCYTKGQSRVVKWLLDNDRGEYVRDEAGYRRILEAVFGKADLHIRSDRSRLPYTFAIGVAKNDV